MAEILGDKQRAHIIRNEERIYRLTTELEGLRHDMQNMHNRNTVTAGEKDFRLLKIAEQLIRAREEAEFLRRRVNRESNAKRSLASLSKKGWYFLFMYSSYVDYMYCI